MRERVSLSGEEDEAKTSLIDCMKEAGFERYETAGGLVVTLTNKAGVKVKKKKEEKEGDEAEDGDDGEE